jgi:hypothetical protein
VAGDNRGVRFGFGHYVEGASWSALLADYNLLDGRLWVFVLIWTLVGPAAIRSIYARRHGGRYESPGATLTGS